MSKPKITSVLGALFSSDGKELLLIKRRDIPVWVFPGGGVEENESPEEAILREMKEETGLSCTIENHIATYYPASTFMKPTNLYRLEDAEGTLIPQLSEVADVQFFPIDKLPHPIPPPFPEWIDDAIANKPHFSKDISSITFTLIAKLIVQHPILSLRFILSRLGFHINN